METLTRSLIGWAVATKTLPGQAESGDLYVVRPFSGGTLVGVVDGLGHGLEAALAAKKAIQILDRHAGEPVISLLRRCHEALRGTRGVVMSLAALDSREGTMTWLGVGNVEGLLLRGDPRASPPRESLLLRGGIVGGRLPLPHASILALARGDTLILATDGINGDFARRPLPARPVQQLADRILVEHGKETDDALVLVARFEGSDP